MISIYNILKEVVDYNKKDINYSDLVDQVAATAVSPKPLGSGNFGTVFLVNDPELGQVAVKVTTESEELEDAQAIEGLDTKYFVKIHEVQVIEPNLGIITMDRLYPYQGSEQEIPIDEIEEEADLLGIYTDLEGSGGSIRVSNIMQTEPNIKPGKYLERDNNNNIIRSKIKVIDV
jgi:hypothetical protein